MEGAAQDDQVVGSGAEAVQLMQAETFDPARVVVIEDSGTVGTRANELNPSGSPSLQPSIISYSPEQVAIDVKASRPGYLVLTDAYYPGWTATVDGRAADIERADIMFRAVKIPAGQHRVEMRYQPQSFSLGLLIANGYQYLLSGKYWISFYPGLALLATIVAINLVADQLRDILNPRLKR